VQGEQLLADSEIFENEVPSRAESTDNPSEEMSERGNHGQHFIETRSIKLSSKSLIL
jgi:hypothetical protein